MTFEPVLPPLVLGVIGVVLVALRLVSLRPAARSGGKALARWGITTLAILLIPLAAARPGWGPVTANQTPAAPDTGENVYVVVDRSADSAIADFGGEPRMSGIRADIERLIGVHPGARFAVIAFASRPAIDWPLSADAWTLRPVVAALTPYPDDAADQVNAGAAATVLRYQLIAAGQQYPRSRNLVYYLGSGAPGSRAPQTPFDADRVDGGAVFGYAAGSGETELRGIAEQLGVDYVSRVPGEPLPPAATVGGQEAAVPSSETGGRDEFTWLPVLLAAALLLVEIYLSLRELRRARALHREAAA